MKPLTDEIVRFLQRQHFVIASTLDAKGNPHSSCKGIVKINRNGRVYLLDLYRMKTFENLKRSSRISITAVNEDSFKGYCLKGKAKEIKTDNLGSYIIKAWEDKIIGRITHRVLKNIRGEKGHSQHPEALLPKPEYLIVMEVEEVIDLTPHCLKEVKK